MRKHITLLLCGVLLSCLLGGCSSSGDSAESTIRIGVLPIADSFPLYVAQEEQLFSKAGLNVEIVEFGSASDQSVAYEAGELDGMMTDMVVQSLVNKTAEDGMKVIGMACGGTEEEGRFLVVSTPGSTIKTPEDLKGVNIGISENTMMEYLVTAYLNELRVGVENANLINIPKLTLRLDAVISGTDIQACILPDPLAIEAENRGCNVVIDDTQLGRNFSQSVVTLRSSIADGNADIAETFKSCYDEAIRQINANPEKYTELFTEKANVADQLAGIYGVPSYTPDCLPTEEQVNAVQNWMVEKGLIDEVSPYEDMVASFKRS